MFVIRDVYIKEIIRLNSSLSTFDKFSYHNWITKIIVFLEYEVK